MQLRMIRYVRSSLDTTSTMLLCNSLVLCRLDYCNTLLIGLSTSDFGQMQRVFNLAARIISRCSSFSLITPVLKSLGWLRVEDRVKLRMLRYVYISGTLWHSVLPDKLPYYSRLRRDIRSSGRLRLEVRTGRTRIGDGAFCCVAPRLWNNLPYNIRCGPSFSVISGFFLDNLLAV